jgi:hypothetical protein
VRGHNTIARLVGAGVMSFCAAGFLQPDEEGQVYGDATCFKWPLIWDRGGTGPFLDTFPHIDYVNPEIGCMALFASTTGGTKVWYGGKGFKYCNNTQPSYARQVRGRFMRCLVAQPNQVLTTPDARTFLHARDKDVVNTEDRVLIRIFFGPRPE